MGVPFIIENRTVCRDTWVALPAGGHIIASRITRYRLPDILSTV
jgi:hypothetical protein